MVLTYLNESCSNTDGYWILPMLIDDCYQYSFGETSDYGKSYKFICNQETQISLGIFSSTDCSDETYESFTLYEDYACLDGEYEEILSCPNDNAIKLTTLFTILLIIVHGIL